MLVKNKNITDVCGDLNAERAKPQSFFFTRSF